MQQHNNYTLDHFNTSKYYNTNATRQKIYAVLVKIYTVKPVYNGHPSDPKILAVVDKWLL